MVIIIAVHGANIAAAYAALCYKLAWDQHKYKLLLIPLSYSTCPRLIKMHKDACI